MVTEPSFDFIITYTLGQGATWGAALTPGILTYTPLGVGVALPAIVGGGGEDENFAEFRVNVIKPVEKYDTFTLEYDINDATALAVAGTAINLAITLTDMLPAPVDTAGSISIFHSADGTTEPVTASACGTLYIDVATSSTMFGGTSIIDLISPTEVILGSVKLANNVLAFESAVKDDGTLIPWVCGVHDAAATVTLTVTGDFSASLAVNQDSVLATADGLYLDLNRNREYDDGEEADTLDAFTATWNFLSTVDIIQLVGIRNNIHMVVDGVTPIETQTPSAILAVDWINPTYLDESETGDLRELAKNGETRNVYNIPGSANFDQAFIRIYNTSPIDGTVRGTLYDQNGLLGTAVLVTDLPAGETQVFSAAALETLFGTTWEKRARMTIDGEIPSMEVQALIRSSTGTITNLSPMAPE
jgi:hypothetical protein